MQTVLPALQNAAIYTLQYTSAFEDDRELHKGPMFNALQRMLRPTHDRPALTRDSVPTGNQEYWKLPSFLHMMEQYMDAALGPEVRLQRARCSLAPSAGSAPRAGRWCDGVADKAARVAHECI